MKTIILKKPVRLGETTPEIRELRFRDELVAGDLRGINLKGLEDFPATDILTIGGRLCGQPDAVMNRLSLADLGQVVEIVLGFLSDGQQTGTGTSQS